MLPVVPLLLLSVLFTKICGASPQPALRRHVERPGVPVLFTSAYTGQEMIRRGLIPPEAPLLQKPFTSEALLAKLREVYASPTAGPRKSYQVQGR